MSKSLFRTDGRIPIRKITPLLVAAMSGIAVLVSEPNVGAGKEETAVSLCSAGKEGVYYFAAERIGEAVPAPELKVQVVETNGSMDNLERMEKGECDAAIVQLDALFIYALERRSKRLKINVPVPLYDEWLHLVCRRESGIKEAGDLLRNPERFTILTGKPGSGSETTWQALTGLDRDYQKISTRAVGGQEALDALVADGSADCMVVVVGANSPFMLRVAERGDALSLVSVDLMDFRDSDLVDTRVYNSAQIPKTTYEKLLAGPGEPQIETIAVRATLVVTKAWARAHPDAYKSFMRAVSKAIPAIRERLKG